MEQQPNPVPPPVHQGEPPYQAPETDIRIPQIILSNVFVLISAGFGGLVWLLDGDLAESLICGALFGVLYQLTLLVLALRGS